MSAPAAAVGPAPARKPLRNVRPTAWARLLHNPMATFGLVLLAVIVAVVLLAPVVPLQSPDTVHIAQRLKPPLAPDHVLGTDQLGRDILSRLIWGTRLSLAVGVFAALMSCLIGSTIGLLAAFRGGWLDTLLMRGIDTLMAFPYLLLALAIVAALGPGLFNAMLAIIVVNVPFFARGVRGGALSVVRTDFMAAARLCGLSDTRIVLSELLPNVLPGIIIGVSTTVGWMILETAGLSFLGLGAQPPQADLGGMLGEGRNLLQIAPHVATIPGVVILLLAIGINLLGDGLRDVLDPKLKAGGLARSQARTDAALGDERRRGLAPPLSDARLPLAIRGLRTEFRVGRSIYVAVGGVDIAIAPGEAVGIVGESGSGKTVMALSVLGLVASPPGRIVGGEILHHGEDMAEADLNRLQEVRGGKIAYVFQDPQTTLNPLIPVGDQVTETIRRHQGVSSGEATRRAIALFESVLIPDAAEKARAYPHELSGGQRQRVGIARALSLRPKLIVADEPVSALDVSIRAQILNLFRQVQADTNVALLFVAHDLGAVRQISHRVAVMYLGKIVETAPADALYDDPRHPYTRALLAAVPSVDGRRAGSQKVEGDVPSPIDIPSGCRFRTRCPFAQEICAQKEPPLAPFEGGPPAHLSACHFAATLPVLNTA